MPGGEPPLTDAARAELAAVATDEALEAARHARLAEQALNRLNADTELRGRLRGQPGTLRPHPPRPPEPGDDGT